MDDLEQKYIKEAFDTNRVEPIGPYVSDKDVKYIIVTIKSAII